MGDLRSAAIEQQEKEQEALGVPDFGEFAELMDDDEQQTAAGVGVADISIVAVTFGTEFLARRKGDHWRLTEPEKIELEKAIAKVAPDIALSPWWMLAATLTGVFAPRIMQDMLQEQEQEQEQAPEQKQERVSDER